MGADLYRSDFKHLSDDSELNAVWEAVVKHRNEVCPQNTFFTDDAEMTPEVVACREAQAEVERIMDEQYAHPKYFRDSYNSSSLFWLIDLSWWGDSTSYLGPNADGVLETYDYKWMDRDGVEHTEESEDYSLHPAGMAKLYRDVEARRPVLEAKLAAMKERSDEDGNVKMDQFSATEPYQDIENYFLGKFDRFLDFLKQAADGGYTIRCSV